MSCTEWFGRPVVIKAMEMTAAVHYTDGTCRILTLSVPKKEFEKALVREHKAGVVRCWSIWEVLKQGEK